MPSGAVMAARIDAAISRSTGSVARSGRKILEVEPASRSEAARVCPVVDKVRPHPAHLLYASQLAQAGQGLRCGPLDQPAADQVDDIGRPRTGRPAS
jgi:hypothetical protein